MLARTLYEDIKSGDNESSKHALAKLATASEVWIQTLAVYRQRSNFKLQCYFVIGSIVCIGIHQSGWPSNITLHGGRGH